MWTQIQCTYKLWSCKFFHGFLGTAEPEEISGYLGKLDKDQKSILKQVAELAIFSEGAVSYTEAWQLSPIERETLIKTVNRYNKLKSGDKSESL